MSQSDDTSATYDVDAARIAGLYESMSSTIVHAQLAEFIPAGPGLALDVGAGSGRDAAWLVSLGYDVVAVEPAAGMRREGRSRHPEPAIRWIDDRLPDLIHVHRLGLSFDVILASAVWMHVPPAVRARLSETGNAAEARRDHSDHAASWTRRTGSHHVADLGR